MEKRRLSITKEELEKKYHSDMGNRALCEELGITNPTLLRLVKESGITLKGRGNRYRKVILSR